MMNRTVMESLEGRRMLSGWTPESVAGLSFAMDIDFGGEQFANWTGSELHLHQTNGTYHLRENTNLMNNGGFFYYTRNNDLTAYLLLNDPFSDFSVGYWLGFNSPDTFNYIAASDKGYIVGTGKILDGTESLGRITGTVFNDVNGNFVRGDGEQGLAGETIYLDVNGDGALNDGEPTAVTDDAGAYIFDSLEPGSYQVRLATPSGQRPTLGNRGFAVKVPEGKSVVRDFGLTARALISGAVFADADRSGTRDAGETGLTGVRVYLDANDNGQYDAGENFVFSNAAGNYFLSAPSEGSFRVRAATPDGQVRTQPVAAAHQVTTTAGSSLYGRNFGFAPAVTGAIAGTVFNDANANYAQDSAETGRPDETVYLDLNKNDVLDEGEPKAVTDIGGNYVFDELAPGSYRVRIQTPEWQRGTLGTRGYDVTVGVSPVTRDFGLTDRGLISGVVFADANGNGQRDPAEAGLAGVRVFRDANWNDQYDDGENFVLTDSAGNYFLSVPPEDLAPIRAEDPEGHIITSPSGGSHLAGGSPGVIVYGRNFGFAPAGMFASQRLVDLDDDQPRGLDPLFDNGSLA